MCSTMKNEGGTNNFTEALDNKSNHDDANIPISTTSNHDNTLTSMTNSNQSSCMPHDEMLLQE